MVRARLLVALIAFNVSAQGSVVYVDDDAPSGGDGQSWSTAFRHLSDAIAQAALPASGVTEIRVGQGAYKPDRDTFNPTGNGNRHATFHLLNLSTLGGFAGLGADDPDVRDPKQYPTILSGDLLANDGAGASGIGENSYHVVTCTSARPTTILDGFIIEAGNVQNPPLTDDGGAGLRIIGGMPAIRHCIFRRNFGYPFVIFSGFFLGGGAVWNSSKSEPTFSDCLFDGNQAWAGAAMTSSDSSPQLIRCRFLNHEGQNGGAAFFRNCQRTRLEDCQFTNNRCSTEGGAIMATLDCAVVITHCEFTGNGGTGSGAALAVRVASAVEIDHCVFDSNQVDGRGGAIFAEDTGKIYVKNSQFINNKSLTSHGGAAYVSDCPMSIANCLFKNNQCAENGGAVRAGSGESNIVIDNSVFDANQAQVSGGAIFAMTGQAAMLTNCRFFGNSSHGNQDEGMGGGAVYLLKQPGLFTQCLFSGNSSARRGGAIHANVANTTLHNCTIGFNEAGAAGGVSCRGISHSHFSNCILWENTDSGGASQSAQIRLFDDATLQIDFTCVQGLPGSLGGGGNIGGLPQFVDPDGLDNIFGTDDDNLQIGAGSACIDAGSNLALPLKLWQDLLGNFRFQDDPATVDTGAGIAPIVDMGAFEFDPQAFAQTVTSLKGR